MNDLHKNLSKSKTLALCRINDDVLAIKQSLKENYKKKIIGVTGFRSLSSVWSSFMPYPSDLCTTIKKEVIFKYVNGTSERKSARDLFYFRPG